MMQQPKRGLVQQIKDVLASGEDRVGKGSQVCKAIRTQLGQKWVGIYDVGPLECSVIAWSGPAVPQSFRLPAGKGLTGEAVWCGFALAAYIIGLSFIARKESTRGGLAYWPCYFLAAPILLALIMDAKGYLQPALLVSAVLGLWVARCLRYTFGGTERNLGRTVSGLLAGIVWVDLLAVVDVERPLALVFLALFLLALFFQRFIPAT